MSYRLAATVAVFIGLLTPATGWSLPPIPGGQAPRAPDDQVEGMIWEYKGTPRGKPKKGEESQLEGTFRIKGTAVFDTGGRIKLPSRKEVKKAVDKVREGKAPELKIPGAAQPKRIGQYRKLSGGRMRIDFDDKDSLNGIMLIRKKKGTADVWIGSYRQREGRKTVREWKVEVRPIED